MANYPASPIPSYSFTKEIEYKTLISQFENGAEQRRNKWSQGKRQFSLVYNAISVSDANILWDFYVARKGAFESFTYTDPITNTPYTVRFLEDRMTYEQFTLGLNKTGLKMIQVL